MRHFDALPGPATLRAKFTPTGYVRGQGRTSFQIHVAGDIATIWTIGPLGWWHDFQIIPAGTSFDEAVRRTFLPRFNGWIAIQAG